MKRSVCALLLVAVSITPSLATASTAIPPDADTALRAPRPEYPAAARARGVEGRGFFIMHIRPDGTVWRVEIKKSTGHRMLDDAAVKAFMQWRFHPGKHNAVGTPVNFTMHGSPY